MATPLLKDSTPIEAGPIIVEDWYSGLDAQNYPGEYVDYRTFVWEALGNGIDQSRATKALRIAVNGLIKHLDLPILGPYQEVEVGQPWGPHDVHHYYIDVHGYVKYEDVIAAHAKETTDDDKTLTVLQHVADWAREAVRHDTDKIPLSKLPRAFYTPQYPEKRLNKGEVLSFEDFQQAQHGARTSGAKIASMFDKIIELLGDEEARERIDELKIIGNPTSRRNIRMSCYIKTQALADFVTSIPSLPREQQKVFNTLSVRILRYILSEEPVVQDFSFDD